MFFYDLVSGEHQQHQQHQHQDFYTNYWLEEDSRKLFQSISEAESALIGAPEHPPYPASVPAAYNGLAFHEAASSFALPSEDYVYPYATTAAADQPCAMGKRNSLTPPQPQAAPLTSHHVQQLSHLCPPFSEEESQLCQRKHQVKTKITRKYYPVNRLTVNRNSRGLHIAPSFQVRRHLNSSAKIKLWPTLDIAPD